MTVRLLETMRVEKPWGRKNLWPGFEPAGEGPIGEIWFVASDSDCHELLVKYIFTSERLSVQVHPNDRQAHSCGLARGKEECWLVLDAEPDATIALGPRLPTGRTELRAAAENGSIEALLDWKKVSAGDFIYVPAGTIHAIGHGLTLVEIQQNSDSTYRLYDYGRPRPLHLDEGVAIANLQVYEAPPNAGREVAGRTILVQGPKFVVERWRGGQTGIRIPGLSRGWVVVISGQGRLDDTDFRSGECFIIEGDATLCAEPDAELLLAYAGSEAADLVPSRLRK